MAKKAKRRDRPPDAKNKKKSIKGLMKNFAKMELGQLRAYIDNLEKLFAAKVKQWQAAGATCPPDTDGRAKLDGPTQS